MRIEIHTPFLDGRDRFEKDDIRTVPDEDGARFIAHGWASTVGGNATDAAQGETTLNIHNAALGTKDSHG
jgi:hypothetical protein